MILGTAQFGDTYGNRVSRKEAFAILERAQELGINTLDTAMSYGCEELLGEFGMKDWKVITKLPGVPIDRHVGFFVCEQIEFSFDRLQIDRFHALLLHSPRQLYKIPALSEVFGSLDVADKYGVSIYEPIEGDFDIVQLPLNIDLPWGKMPDAEIHGRSVFGRGKLLEKYTIRECLAFALPQVDELVIGVESVKQLEQVYDTLHSTGENGVNTASGQGDDAHERRADDRDFTETPF